MAKTAKQIQNHIIKLLQDSLLVSSVNGKVYRGGYRPVDSESEDIIVIHTAGIPDQVQTGIVTINIYVKDVPMKQGKNEYKVENGSRTAQIEELAQQWVESLSDCFYFELKETITTEKDNDRPQHFVVVKLNYEFLNN